MTESEAVAAVISAIRNEGPRPAWHRQTMTRHRKEWPMLWAALDALVRATPTAAGGE